jgi:hypothetical protein
MWDVIVIAGDGQLERDGTDGISFPYWNDESSQKSTGKDL